MKADLRRMRGADQARRMARGGHIIASVFSRIRFYAERNSLPAHDIGHSRKKIDGDPVAVVDGTSIGSPVFWRAKHDDRNADRRRKMQGLYGLLKESFARILISEKLEVGLSKKKRLHCNGLH
jgi:hypothetical protein